MRDLSVNETGRKLRLLATDGGFESVIEMLRATAIDSVSPAICTDPDCDYVTEMEPDQDRGFCDECRKNTMASALILAGLI